jgi:hypothetical protein
MEGDSAFWMREAVSDTAEARRVVESLVVAGATSIKVHDLMSPEEYSAVVRASRRVGLPVVGHIPITMIPDEVIAANQRSIIGTPT